MTGLPPVKFYSFRRGAPLPHPCDRYEVHPDADPLCLPHLDALRMGLQMDSPMDWALTRTDGENISIARSKDGLHWTRVGVLHRPISNFICAGKGSDARLVMVDGQIAYRDGTVCRF